MCAPGSALQRRRGLDPPHQLGVTLCRVQIVADFIMNELASLAVAWGIRLLFLDNDLHFLENAPLAIVWFVLWGSVGASMGAAP
jgi:hypothetical protein